MKAVVAAFNQEKALVGAFYVIVQPVVEPMDSFTALALDHYGVGLIQTGRPLTDGTLYPLPASG